MSHLLAHDITVVAHRSGAMATIGGGSPENLKADVADLLQNLNLTAE